MVLTPPYPMLAATGSLSDVTEYHTIEPKLDGIRCLAVYENGQARLFNRQLVDITSRFPEITLRPAARNCILDGEIICTSNGEADFQAVQTRANRVTDIEASAQTTPAILMNFDILFLNDVSVLKFPTRHRNFLLHDVLPSQLIVTSLDSREAGIRIGNQTGEGLMLKDSRSPYTPGKRSNAWLKVKWEQEQVVYVSNIIPGIGKRASSFGALRVHDATGKDLGKVGTGFTDNDLDTIMAMKDLIIHKAIKVRYNDTTNDGKLRFPRFIGFA